MKPPSISAQIVLSLVSNVVRFFRFLTKEKFDFKIAVKFCCLFTNAREACSNR
jgi:hypothetical protein